MQLKFSPTAVYGSGVKTTATFIAAVVLTLAVFGLSIYLSLGYTVWLLYTIPLVFISFVNKKPVYTYLVLLLCIIAVGAEYSISHTPLHPQVALYNRVTGIAVFLYLTYILNYKKSLENRLIESESLFRITFEQAGAGIVHADSQGRWIRINDKFCEIVGHTREEFEKLTPADIIHPNDLNKEVKLRKKLLSGEIPFYKMEKRYIRSDSSVACTIFTCTVLKTQSDATLLVGVVEDITERKISEEEIKNSESLLKQILHLMPVGIWLLNGKGEIAHSNPCAKKLWAGVRYVGIENFEEFKGWRADSGEPLGAHDWAAAKAIEKGETHINELIDIQCFNGQRKTIYNSAMPLRENSGKIIGAIAVNQDLTELIRVEQELKISEEKFRTIAETMPLIVWTAEPDGKFDYLNQRSLEFTGAKAEDVTGFGWYNFLHPDSSACAEEKWLESIKTGKILEDTSLIRRHDGQYRWFLTRSVPLRDDKGNIIKWFGTATEIHDQKETEKKLNEALKKLERSNQDLEQFAYIASHDLKEPLRMVKNYMQLLEKKYKGVLDESAGTYINFAVDGATRMNALISDLLLYAKVSSKPKEFELVDLNKMTEKVLEDLQLSIKESGASVNYAGLPVVMADSLQMRQLFQNLIQNAIKFRNVQSPVIEIRSEKMSSHWLITVKDNGIGIDPQFKERIFIIFQRLHEREKYPGTGMGLAICKRIVEHHGGRIWVESEVGSGTTFYFIIPAIEA
ncbi:MAG TPA: PAS domain S-box protein [Ignavibacteriales bacterium]|nr:PAS domain S-box protein [Ignavibacteriales bacterium]